MAEKVQFNVTEACTYLYEVDAAELEGLTVEEAEEFVLQNWTNEEDIDKFFMACDERTIYRLAPHKE